LPVIELMGLRTHEAMAVLNCSKVTRHQLLKSGELPSSKIGGMRILHMVGIRKLLADTTAGLQIVQPRRHREEPSDS
jgi:hypothetical protein